MSKRNALEVRQKLEAAHPEITIKSPLSSKSGKWELEVGDADTTFFDSFWPMVDSLAGQYQDVEAL
jgi:hypothetical protein